jgi:hypothetical protein
MGINEEDLDDVVFEEEEKPLVGDCQSLH